MAPADLGSSTTSNLFNIGAEGQLYVGALAAVASISIRNCGPASAATTASAAEDVSVIVREVAGAGDAALGVIKNRCSTVGVTARITIVALVATDEYMLFEVAHETSPGMGFPPGQIIGVRHQIRLFVAGRPRPEREASNKAIGLQSGGSDR